MMIFTIELEVNDIKHEIITTGDLERKDVVVNKVIDFTSKEGFTVKLISVKTSEN